MLETKPFDKLVISWSSPEDAGKEDKTSRVTFELKVIRDAVRLTVCHEDLEPNSRMLTGITQGWPAVLSSLKTFLETGQAMPLTLSRFEGALA